MEYRLLGDTGLKVSVIGYGNAQLVYDDANQKALTETVKKCLELGINFFDTAEFYGNGEAEIALGNSFKALNVPREDIVVSTKIFWGSKREDGAKKVNAFGLNRKHVKEGIKNSLKRLQLDYADVIFCHRFDEETPVEEVARAFTELIQEGVIHYWGTSEWTAANIFEVREICAEKNLIKPIAEQPQYSMIARDKIEVDYIRLFDKYRMGSTVWSPLAGGLLTGKFNKGVQVAGTRYENPEHPFIKQFWDQLFSTDKKDKSLKLLNGLESLAKELGMSQAQLAMGWVIANKNVSSAITGGSKLPQIEEIVNCVQHYKKITPEIEKRINAILENTPDQGINYKTFAPKPPRR